MSVAPRCANVAQKSNRFMKSPAVKQIYKANQVSEVARACRITTQAIAQWRKVPYARVLIVERVTGIPRHQIRPDIYPPPKQRA